ncbi:MAG: NlpC/P60 family protein [Candidatus Zixiibacteriota bacterium]
MKRPALLIPVLLAALVGCTANPRYRTGGAERPAEVRQRPGGLTTNDYLRLGTILQDYLGRPYKGRSIFVRGVDCSFFTQEVFDKFNRTELPRTVARQFQQGREVAYRHLAVGDLVFFRTEGGKVSHVGIYVGQGQFIHASTSRGVIIDSLKEKYWARCYAGARRILAATEP